ncbi:uncharacterized protein SRS1_16668 [Sporisorium reilianum f. sp. reilianum]|uniref:Uncharacterized protein n=1 Tax=Sporisorium reilianum f. sp. reilianum TaxID=72559 RepID=A0A2N8UN72_9BASI|nr:uncharacterized protein SRS1_16668 [Sporisorium reilianum f. sp. reilianum]
MFLPRKLQKRSHPGRNAQSSGAGSAANGANQDVGQAKSEAVERVAAAVSSSSACTPQVEASSSAPSKAEADTLDRLVEFLYMRLSPLSLAAHHTAHTHDDLYTALLHPPEQHDDRSAKPHTTHLARLHTLVPGLATRCPSIALLAHALQTLAAGPAPNWYTLHHRQFVVEWSRDYMHTLSTHRDSAALAPLLVYVESMPPRIRTRTHAASYVNGLMQQATVEAVLEPSVVDRCFGSRWTRVVEGQWTSGRAFVLVSTREGVERLCSAYPWDVRRARAEPIRCLSWPAWVEMRELYRAQQQHPAPPLDVTPPANHPWHRGTILLLPLPATHPLTLPPTPHTPLRLNTHLKPQLEQHVPESIAYIHALTTNEIAVRTAHAALAARLRTAFPQLTRMDAAQEDAYWSGLPDKTRAAARRRAQALDDTLANAQRRGETGPSCS